MQVQVLPLRMDSKRRLRSKPSTMLFFKDFADAPGTPADLAVARGSALVDAWVRQQERVALLSTERLNESTTRAWLRVPEHFKEKPLPTSLPMTSEGPQLISQSNPKLKVVRHG